MHKSFWYVFNILFIISLVCIFTSTTVNADTTATVDINTCFLTDFEYAETSFIYYVTSLYKNGISMDDIKYFSNEVDAGYGVYFAKTDNGDISAITYQIASTPEYGEKSKTLFNSQLTLTTKCVKVYIMTYYTYYPSTRTFAKSVVNQNPRPDWAYEWIPVSVFAMNDDLLYTFTQQISHNAPDLTKIYEAIINSGNNIKLQLDRFKGHCGLY